MSRNIFVPVRGTKGTERDGDSLTPSQDSFFSPARIHACVCPGTRARFFVAGFSAKPLGRWVFKKSGKHKANRLSFPCSGLIQVRSGPRPPPVFPGPRSAKAFYFWNPVLMRAPGRQTYLCRASLRHFWPSPLLSRSLGAAGPDRQRHHRDRLFKLRCRKG